MGELQTFYFEHGDLDEFLSRTLLGPGLDCNPAISVSASGFYATRFSYDDSEVVYFG